MSTIKFDLHDELNELLARIYLDTRKKITKKELLEIVFRIGMQDYSKIVEAITQKRPILTEDTIRKIEELSEDFGEGTEKSSEMIDEILYGE